MKLIDKLNSELDKGIPAHVVEFTHRGYKYSSAIWSLHRGAYHMLRSGKGVATTVYIK